MPDLLLRIIVTAVTIIDAILNYIVVDGNLTDPKGNQIVDAIATIMNNVTEFLAQFTTVLVNGTSN